MRLWNYVEQGGPIMYILLLMNVIGLSLIIWRVFTLKKAHKGIDELSSAICKETKLPSDYGIAVNLVKDEVSLRVHAYEFGLNSIKVIASIAPLIGLLGTVVGILMAFGIIADGGMGEPTLFAGAISMALVTTVGGLIVAIPHYVGYYYLVGLLDDLEMKLEKKTISTLFSGDK